MTEQLRDADGRYWLTHGMARAAGFNLSEEIKSGRISRSMLAEMISRCATCEMTDACVLHLANALPGGTPVPDWCQHAKLLNNLES